MRGYIAMLAVKKEHRGRGIASKLVRMAMDGMIARDADEVGYLSRPNYKNHVLTWNRLHWRLRLTIYPL
jgi:ribosomal protein S18 acetylase RimI-like enzyme